MKHKVIYTCLFGKYDNLLQPLVVDDTFDYICFTDDKNLQSDGVWQKKHINFKCNDNTLKSRYAKILPHKVLSKYDVSLYIDANIQIKTSRLYTVIDKLSSQKTRIAQVEHPSRKCIYEELEACYNWRLITTRQHIFHRLRYRSKGMPKKWGLYENNIIFRMHNDPFVQAIDEKWWKEYKLISRRDQLSLALIYFIKNFRPVLLFGEGFSARNVDCLHLYPHARHRSPQKTNMVDLMIACIQYRLKKYHIIRLLPLSILYTF